MKKINIFIFLILLLLNSCLESNYKPLEIPEHLKTTKEIEDEYDFIKEWWKKYDDKNLNYFVDLALNNNKDYLNATMNVNKELYRLNKTIADLFPNLFGSLSASTGRDIYRHDEFTKTFSGELGVNYELDLLGKIRDIKNAQELEYKATIVDLESAKLTLINNVIDLYYNIIYIRDAIKLTQDTVKNYNKILEINKNRYNVENIDIAELKQVEQSNLTANNNLLNLQSQYSELLKSFRILLNVNPNFDLKFSSSKDLMEVKTSKIINTDILISFLSNRPDVLSSQIRLEKSFKEVKQANKQWWPSIKLNGILSSSSNKAKKTFEFGRIAGGISISLPFLDWVRVKNDIKISKVEYQQQKLAFESSINTALNEIGYYNDLYENSTINFENLNMKNQNQERIINVYKNRYNVGSIELEDLLKQLNDVNSATMNLLQAKYQTIKYENMMHRAMGGMAIKKDNKAKQI